MADMGQALCLLIIAHAFPATLVPFYLFFFPFLTSTHSIFTSLFPLLPSLYSKHHAPYTLDIFTTFSPPFIPEISQLRIYLIICLSPLLPHGLLNDTRTFHDLCWALGWAQCSLHSSQPSGPLHSPCLTSIRRWACLHLAEKLEAFSHQPSSLNLLSFTKTKPVIFAPVFVSFDPDVILLLLLTFDLVSSATYIFCVLPWFVSTYLIIWSSLFHHKELPFFLQPKHLHLATPLNSRLPLKIKFIFNSLTFSYKIFHAYLKV